MFTHEISVWELIPIWLGSIGTLAAVIVAPYLAGRDRRINCKVNVNISILMDNLSDSHSKYLSITVTNSSFRSFTLNGFSWRIGVWSKKYLWQVPPQNEFSSRLPIKLNDGEEAKFFIPIKTFELHIYPELKVNSKYFKYFTSRFTKIVVNTSVKNLTFDLNKSFRKVLVNYDFNRTN
jgi:hypothetical protein